MSFINKRLIKILAAVVGMFAMAITASRQLYLFTIFRDAGGVPDPQGGAYHLWLALAAALMASVAGGLMFFFMLRHRNKEDVLRVN